MLKLFVRTGIGFVKNSLFGKYLLVTNTCIGGGMMLTGDYIQQRIERFQGRVKQYDEQRGLNMATVGMTMAPIQHVIYSYMEKIWPSNHMRFVVRKLIADQATVAPICIFIFFYGTNLLEGKDVQTASEELRKKFVTVYLADCAIWVPCQLINFLYLPAKYRVLYVNCILVGYNVFLSYIKYNDKNLAVTEA